MNHPSGVPVCHVRDLVLGSGAWVARARLARSELALTDGACQPSSDPYDMIRDIYNLYE